MSTAAGQKLLPGISSIISATNELIRAAALNDRPAFITGEPGTEKAFAAKLIHQLSARAPRPMTKINVSWKLPPDLSQYFERCSGGTLIIHLQKEFPIDMQYTLVEMTNHGAFADPLSGEIVESDVRVILITSLDWEELGERTPLLPELKEILTSQHIEIPPLRSRPEDIPALVRYAVKRALDTGRTRAHGVEPGVLWLFRQWNWPGNAEDLLLVTAQAAITCAGDSIGLEHLPEHFTSAFADEVIAEAKEIKSPAGAALRIQGGASSPSSQEAPLPPMFTPVPDEERRIPGQARPDESRFQSAEPPPAPRDVQPAATASAEDKTEGEKEGAGSTRVLALARRLNAQASLLSRQFSGPLDANATQALVDRIIAEATDEDALETLEKELDRGLDLVLALRRQMAVLNVRQQQNAETVRDLIQRLSTSGGGVQNNEVAEETRELADSLRAIDKIIKRVSEELPHVGQHLESTLLGNPSERRNTTSGIFRKIDLTPEAK